MPWDSERVYAPPSTQDHFSYSLGRGFEVEVKAGYKSEHHCREESNTLYNLLTYTEPPPLLTKKGTVAKRQPPPHKDQSAAFYEAQLIHYGLKPFKTKPAAKKALLAEYAAAPDSKLNVPQHILKIESDLKARFKEANALAKSKYATEKEARRQREVTEALERKRANQGLMDEVDNLRISKRKLGKSSDETGELHISGRYDVVAPMIFDRWDQASDLTVTLAASAAGSHLWGSFHFGIFSGILRSTTSVEDIENSGRAFLLWRGREEGEGEMTFSAKNLAMFEFLSSEIFSGTMYWECSGAFELAGKQVVKKNVAIPGSVIKRWKEEWKGYNERAYERAGVGRWGGSSWGGDY